MLDVINAQGAQVKALEARVETLQRLLILVAASANTLRFSPKDIEAIDERVAGINWRANKDGTIIISLKAK